MKKGIYKLGAAPSEAGAAELEAARHQAIGAAAQGPLLQHAHVEAFVLGELRCHTLRRDVDHLKAVSIHHRYDFINHINRLDMQCCVICHMSVLRHTNV